jgi:hypothetical protein
MTLRSAALSAVVAFCLGVSPPCAHAAPEPAPSASAPGPAGELSGPAVAECVAAHDNAALLRLKDDWVDARAAMQRCGNDACPIAIRSDCRAWLDELVAALPTLLVVVERDDDGTRPVRLDLDGRALELPEKLGPIELVPGAHRLRFTLEGYAPLDVDVTLDKGEKNHVVRARFERPRAVAPVLRPSAPPERRERPVPLASYLYGGGSLLLLATSGALLGAALDSRATARDVCAPACPKDRRESIQRRLLIADLVGVAGIGLGGLAAYSYATRPWVTAASVGVTVAPGRAGLTLRGRF